MNRKLEKEIDAVKALSLKELCKLFNCKPQEICKGNYIARETEDKVCPYKVILGFANFEKSEVEDLGKLEIVYGSKFPERSFDDTAVYLGLNLANSKITNLGKIKKIYGSISLNNNISDLGNIEFLGSNLYLNDTKIKTLGNNLKEINGRLNVENCCLESTGGLEKVNTIYINSKNFKDFSGVKAYKQATIKFVYSQDSAKCSALDSARYLLDNKRHLLLEKKHICNEKYSEEAIKLLTDIIKTDIALSVVNRKNSVKTLEQLYLDIKSDGYYLQNRKSDALKKYSELPEEEKQSYDEFYISYLKGVNKRALLKLLISTKADAKKLENGTDKFISNMQNEILAKSQKKLDKFGIKTGKLSGSKEIKEQLLAEINRKLDATQASIDNMNAEDPYIINYLKLTYIADKNYKLSAGVYNKVEKNTTQNKLSV